MAHKNLRIFEAQNKTGNSVLDTVLNSKSLLCAEQGISLTSMVNGALLDFMDAMDICTIFGNALDNAIEYEMTLDDPAKRLIHLVVVARKSFVIIRVENYFQGKIKYRSDGFPETTKTNPAGQTDTTNHGFGIKSINYAAQKYGGTVTVETKPEGIGSRFELKVLEARPCQAT